MKSFLKFVLYRIAKTGTIPLTNLQVHQLHICMGTELQISAKDSIYEITMNNANQLKILSITNYISSYLFDLSHDY